MNTISKFQNPRLSTVILFVIAILVGIAVFNGFSKDKESAATYDGQLYFLNKITGETIKKINIEIADTDAKRSQGLMWRRSLEDDSGMLFIFDEEGDISFWMKNTLIPLDIIFVNESMEIVKIHRETIPLSNIALSSGRPAKYAVEVNANFCHIHKIKVGDKMKFEITK